MKKATKATEFRSFLYSDFRYLDHTLNSSSVLPDFIPIVDTILFPFLSFRRLDNVGIACTRLCHFVNGICTTTIFWSSSADLHRTRRKENFCLKYSQCYTGDYVDLMLLRGKNKCKFHFTRDLLTSRTDRTHTHTRVRFHFMKFVLCIRNESKRGFIIDYLTGIR